LVVIATSKYKDYRWSWDENKGRDTAVAAGAAKTQSQVWDGDHVLGDTAVGELTFRVVEAMAL
jgi:hypothetical protein